MTRTHLLIGSLLLMATLMTTVAADPPAKTMTLTGDVVDAACYLIHPPAATGHSHDQCGRACVERGVPIGVANEADKDLYLAPGDRDTLLPYLHQRVKVTGKVVRRNEPLKLEMPVGANNSMAVEITGGYNALSVEKVEKAPKAKP